MKKVCFACKDVKKLWVCRDCGAHVCAHLCGNKDGGVATCGKCKAKPWHGMTGEPTPWVKFTGLDVKWAVRKITLDKKDAEPYRVNTVNDDRR